MGATIFEDLQQTEYKKAWEYQESIFDEIIGIKLHNRENQNDLKDITNRLLFVEHPNVYTLGKSGAINNLLINDDFLKKINASYYKSNRGGDITYHGPGQIVGYPIFDLELMGLTVKSYIHKLEQAIINCLADYGIVGDRLDGATGVWLDKDVPGKARKISAIGVKASRYVSMHGFALNVNTDLSYFNHINPCGFVDKGVTSMEKELGAKQDFEKVKADLLNHLVKVFELNLNN
ncbi:lipoyl(octanoyl) transferase LipB [Saccharicrinis aurantiacus]|uniref:lipoyl(octanoyl) transferase LipB n=1 Tax=Saccharicrinis aurantiacus TaxID=1849719 RepID=UPI002492F696|nr:lipoyl(octanoyl) transferase LipB [Saccharicrinis aurantiacus]